MSSSAAFSPPSDVSFTPSSMKDVESAGKQRKQVQLEPVYTSSVADAASVYKVRNRKEGDWTARGKQYVVLEAQGQLVTEFATIVIRNGGSGFLRIRVGDATADPKQLDQFHVLVPATQVMSMHDAKRNRSKVFKPQNYNKFVGAGPWKYLVVECFPFPDRDSEVGLSFVEAFGFVFE